MLRCCSLSFFFFFNDTATTEIYTLSLHDALPIWGAGSRDGRGRASRDPGRGMCELRRVCGGVRDEPVIVETEPGDAMRSEEHTSELQSRLHLVCRLLLEKKKKQNTYQ